RADDLAGLGDPEQPGGAEIDDAERERDAERRNERMRGIERLPRGLTGCRGGARRGKHPRDRADADADASDPVAEPFDEHPPFDPTTERRAEREADRTERQPLHRPAAERAAGQIEPADADLLELEYQQRAGEHRDSDPKSG